MVWGWESHHICQVWAPTGLQVCPQLFGRHSQSHWLTAVPELPVIIIMVWQNADIWSDHSANLFFLKNFWAILIHLLFWMTFRIHSYSSRKKNQLCGSFYWNWMNSCTNNGLICDVTWQIYLAQSLSLRTCHNSLFMWGLSYVLQLCFLTLHIGLSMSGLFLDIF